MGRRHTLAVFGSLCALAGLYACVGDSPNITNVIEGDAAAPDATVVDGNVADTSATDAGADATAVDGACLIDASGNVEAEYSLGIIGIVSDIALDSQSARIEVGNFTGSSSSFSDASVTAQAQDAFVVKRSSGLSYSWSQTISGTNNEIASSVAVDGNDDAYVAGSTFSPTMTIGAASFVNSGGAGFEMGFVAKFNGADGTLLWTQTFAQASATAGSGSRCLRVAASGTNIALGCHFAGAPIAFAGPDASAATMTDYPGGNVALFTLDQATGNVISQTQIGTLDAGSTIDAGDVMLQGLDVTTKGFPVASGSFTGPWLKDKALDISIIRQSAVSDGWLTELNSQGKADWQKDFAADGGVSFVSSHTDGAGNVLVIGDFAGAANFGGAQLSSVGGNDIFVADIPGGTTTGGGAPIWEKVIGGPDDDFGIRIAYDSCSRPIAIAQVSGDVVVDGVAFPQEQAGGPAVTAAMKFTTGGTLLWAHGPAPTAGNGVAPSTIVGYPGGNTLVAGSFHGTVDLGNGYVPTSNGTNPFEIFFSH